MSVAGGVCAVVLLYPALCAAAIAVLDCVTLDTMLGPVRVLRTDTAVSCEGSAYRRAAAGAWAVLAVVGVGGPLLNVGATRALATWTCGGSRDVARALMAFMTGGYRADAWYFEGVVMAQKLLVVVCVTLLGGGLGLVLGCVWTLLAALLAVLWARPFESGTLLWSNVFSLCALATMFGLCGVVLLLEEDSGNERAEDRTALGAVVGLVHLAALANFVIAAAVVGLQDLRRARDRSRREVLSAC